MRRGGSPGKQAAATRARRGAGPLLPDCPEGPAQDLAIHRGEIHGKLVAIMRERLAAALAQLPAAAAGWAAAPRAGAPAQPSPLAAGSAKQLRILTQARGAAPGAAQSPPPPGGGRSRAPAEHLCGAGQRASSAPSRQGSAMRA
jgi:hypothetical protein